MRISSRRLARGNRRRPSRTRRSLRSSAAIGQSVFRGRRRAGAHPCPTSGGSTRRDDLGVELPRVRRRRHATSSALNSMLGTSARPTHEQTGCSAHTPPMLPPRACTPTNPAGTHRCRLESTRSACGRRGAKPGDGHLRCLASARCKRRTSRCPRRARRRRALSTSPRRASPSPIVEGRRRRDVASSVARAPTRSRSGRCRVRPTQRHASSVGSPAVSTRAASHHNGPTAGMALDDPPAGRDEAGRVECERRECGRRLLHEDARVGA